jgi:ABC-type phosphate transport system substrate-binding protein
MKKSFVISMFAVALTFTLAMVQPAFSKNTITYVGCSTVGKFMQEAASAYTDTQFKINTKPESGGDEMATAAGKTDIGGVAREVKPEILSQGITKYLIGKDAI